MASEPEGRIDGGATDVRGVRLCACSRSLRFKKASGAYDGNTTLGFGGGERAFRAPVVGYEAYGMHRAERRRVCAIAGRRRPEEGERTGLLHGLHCLDTVGGVCAPYVKLGIQ